MKIIALTLWYKESLANPLSWVVGQNGVESITFDENKLHAWVIKGKVAEKAFELRFDWNTAGSGVTYE